MVVVLVDDRGAGKASANRGGREDDDQVTRSAWSLVPGGRLVASCTVPTCSSSIPVSSTSLDDAS